jgi:hypothetical protein
MLKLLNNILFIKETEEEWKSVSKSRSKSTLDQKDLLTHEEKMSNISSIRSLRTDESQLTSNQKESSQQSNSTSFKDTKNTLITSSDNCDPSSYTSSNKIESELDGIDSSFTKTMSSVALDGTSNKLSPKESSNISEKCCNFVNQK